MKDVSSLILPRPTHCQMVENCEGIPKWLPCIYFNGNQDAHLMLDIGCCDDHRLFDPVLFVNLNKELIQSLAPILGIGPELKDPQVFYEKVPEVPEA